MSIFGPTGVPTPARSGEDHIPEFAIEVFGSKRKRTLLDCGGVDDAEFDDGPQVKRMAARANDTGGLSRDPAFTYASADIAKDMADGTGPLAYGSKRFADLGLGNSRRENSSMTLSNFATNTAKHMGTTINMLVTNADSFYTGDLLPFAQTEDLHFEQDVITFDTRLLENVPEFGAGRIQGSTRHTTSWSLDRKAAGIHVSADMLRTQAGLDYVGLQVKQIWNCVTETNNYNVIYALITSQNCARRRIADLNTAIDARSREDLVQESLWLWDSAKARFGLEKLDTHANNVITSYGGRADVWIVPSEVADHMALDNPARTTESVIGAIQTERYLTDGGDAFKVWPRGKVYIPRHFLVSDKLPVNPLQFTSMIGEHYVVRSGPTPHQSIQIYDEPNDGWSSISIADAADNDPFIRRGPVTAAAPDPNSAPGDTTDGNTATDAHTVRASPGYVAALAPIAPAAPAQAWSYLRPSDIVPSVHYQLNADTAVHATDGTFTPGPGANALARRTMFGMLAACGGFPSESNVAGLAACAAAVANAHVDTIVATRNYWNIITAAASIPVSGATAVQHTAADALIGHAIALLATSAAMDRTQATVGVVANHIAIITDALNAAGDPPGNAVLITAVGAATDDARLITAFRAGQAALVVGPLASSVANLVTAMRAFTGANMADDREFLGAMRAIVLGTRGTSRAKIGCLWLACQSFDRQSIRVLSQAGCPLPIAGLIIRPHMRYTTLACIKMLAGGETGHTWHRDGDFSWGQDAAHKELRGSYSFHCKAVVEKPENVFLDRTAFVNGYVGGGSAEFFPIDKGAGSVVNYAPDYNHYFDEDDRFAGNRDPSLFSILIPHGWASGRGGVPSRLRLTGIPTYQPVDDTYALHVGGHRDIPDLALYDAFWKWTNKEANMSFMRSQQLYNQMTQPNYITFSGHTRRANPSSGLFGEQENVDTGKGHWGAGGTYIGCNRVRRGDISKDRIDTA